MHEPRGAWHLLYCCMTQYSKDEDPIVADSCIVALDMLKHEQSGEFEYCSK